MKHKIAYVPEDRTREGAILDQPISFNLSLAVLDTLSSFGLVKSKSDRELSADYIKRLGVRTSGPAQLLSALSGGTSRRLFWVSGWRRTLRSSFSTILRRALTSARSLRSTRSSGAWPRPA